MTSDTSAIADATRVRAPRVDRSSGETRFPASFAQQRLWLLSRLLPMDSVYNVGQTLRLVGALDVGALERALRDVARRHESLRTHFAPADGVPLQVVGTDLDVALPVEPVHGASPGELTAEALRLAQAEAQRGFDLARGPLWRARLWRLAPDEHWLQLTLHHIVTDGWSTTVLMRELSALYSAHCSGQPSPLAPLTVQYADYAVWQRQWLTGDVLARQVDYWRRTLAGLPELVLPKDRARPAVPSYRGGRVRRELSPALVEALQALSRREGATLFMTLLAAFDVLLFRYSGQDDFAIGVPIAGRTRPEVEGLIGFFVNMLVLRADLSGTPGFTAHLARVRQRALEAYAHQDVPFEKLVEELAPRRDLSRNPLFQVSLGLHNMPPAQWRLHGLDVERVEAVHNDSAKFDLAMSFTARDGALDVSFHYACDLFDAETIERLADQFQVLLEGIVADPARSITRLPLLTPAERARMLSWGAPRSGTATPRCVHERFAEHAARAPERPAVVGEGRTLAYGDLDARANRLAQHLRTLGVRPGVLVALCLPRSLDLVVTMLSILKAGGAYVPLDPDYPAQRLAFMLDDARAPVLVTRSALLGRLPPFDGRTVCLDEIDGMLGTYAAVPPDTGATADDLAYVIYTSGSTGRPKGVAVAHSSVDALVREPNYVALGPEDTIAHASNVAFDAATFEVWGALANGARLAIVERSDALAAAGFAAMVASQGITCAFLTTALFNAIAREDPCAFRGLRYLLFGGEAHDPARVGEVMRASPPAHLVHVYGPTETTTFATFHEVRVEEAGRRIPIGRPISGAGVLILDREGEPVPVGIVGEIHIAGAGVARGYHERPRESAERFVAHPWCHESRGIVYRTGDLGRWNADGEIEFAGRNDDQLKIRGYRIEPAEIAATIARHPGVRACHVLARRGASGDSTLVAYFVPADAQSPVASRALHQHAAAELPSFMVPASFVAMPAFPIAPGGKLDIAAFPQPAPGDGIDSAAYVAPRDSAEGTLCRIWAEVLGVERVGIDDDFFAIGGHSLLAARVFSRIDGEFRRSLPLGALFETPTVRQLAARLREAPATDFSSLVAITRGGARPPVHVVPGVFGNVVGFADLGRALGPAQPLYALQAVGLDGSRAPLASIEAIARHYLAEIRAVQPKGPYAFMGACFGAVVAYEMARQAMASGETMAYLGLLDPTPRIGWRAERPGGERSRTLTRMRAVADLARDRLRAYGGEMRTLRARGRFVFVAQKTRRVLQRVAGRIPLDVKREINEREVYLDHVDALDGYRLLPLVGDLRMFAIIETALRRPHRRRDRAEWERMWHGRILRHTVPGKDSGDMLGRANVAHVAALVSEHLRSAFAAQAAVTTNDHEEDRSVVP